MPRSVKVVRALLVFIAIFLVLNTLARVANVQQYGATGGIPRQAAIALLAVAGAVVFLGCVGAFILLSTPSRMNWWLVLLFPVLTACNIAIAIGVIPEDHVGVGTVLDVYFFNGLLPITASGVLLKRSARLYFGVTRAAESRKAA
jgi:hypothetical protein